VAVGRQAALPDLAGLRWAEEECEVRAAKAPIIERAACASSRESHTLKPFLASAHASQVLNIPVVRSPVTEGARFISMEPAPSPTR